MNFAPTFGTRGNADLGTEEQRGRDTSSFGMEWSENSVPKWAFFFPAFCLVCPQGYALKKRSSSTSLQKFERHLRQRNQLIHSRLKVFYRRKKIPIMSSKPSTFFTLGLGFLIYGVKVSLEPLELYLFRNRQLLSVH